ncbi:MAG: hypothetical protein A2158_02175 [Chloroflexi bacterium RBG_13_46_14]|nr:MAG: hypothetical protein A2158_02175 [Chloroflexi bacterium RBG_13_46_14]
MKKSNRNASGNIKKLTLPDGLQVGIVNLDSILQEVADLELSDTRVIGKELIDRVKTCNYVAAGAEKEYLSALIHEYQKRFSPEGVSHRIDPKKPHAG